jgi:ferric-dicitrate binding protein FerR (iron transport regulator)
VSRLIDLIHQWTCESLTPEEESELAALLSLGDAESETAFELLHVEALLRAEHLDLDVTAPVVNEIQRHEADVAARKVLDRIAEKSPPRRSDKPLRHTKRAPLLRPLATVAAVLIVVGGIAWTVLSPTQQQDRLVFQGTVKIETPDGLVDYDGKGRLPLGTRIATGDNSTTCAQLSDGTDIQLASHTTLAVTRNDSAVRVELDEGQVIAQVAKQPPGDRFSVRTPNLSVEVVGTRFSVSHDAGVTEVTVEEGAVDVVFPGSSRRERLSAGEDLTASESGVLAGPVEEYWREGFEQSKLAQWWSVGRRIETAEAPPGNASSGCLEAAADRDTYYNRDILVARMSNERSGLFQCDGALVVRFKYYAAPSCGWIGIWMQTTNGEKYFLPVKATLGSWQSAEVRLQQATSTSGNQEKPMPPGEVIRVLIFQAGRTNPDSAFYLDDLSINRSPPNGP